MTLKSNPIVDSNTKQSLTHVTTPPQNVDTLSSTTVSTPTAKSAPPKKIQEKYRKKLTDSSHRETNKNVNLYNMQNSSHPVKQKISGSYLPDNQHLAIPTKPKKRGVARRGPAIDWSKTFPLLLKTIRDGNHICQACRILNIPYQTVQNFADRKNKWGEIRRAQDECAHVIAQRCRETARGLGDSSGDVKRDRLIIETDLKLLSKWSPSIYGDKLGVEMEHSGQIQVNMSVMTEERRAKIAQMRKQALHARLLAMREMGIVPPIELTAPNEDAEEEEKEEEK